MDVLLRVEWSWWGGAERGWSCLQFAARDVNSKVATLMRVSNRMEFRREGKRTLAQ